MSDPWLSIIGIGEDGLPGLPPASRAALDAADQVWGAPRHLALAGIEAARARVWPVPFALDGLLAGRGAAVTTGIYDNSVGPSVQDRLLARRGDATAGHDGEGRAGTSPLHSAPDGFPVEHNAVAPLPRIAMLVSGDPFWHGAGGSVAARLAPGEWRAFPAPGSFSLAAARLGWRIEDTLCLGLHAAPFARLRADLAPGLQAICLMRDGDAPAAFAAWLTEQGFGLSDLWVLERLGGPSERTFHATAAAFALTGIKAPVAVAIRAKGAPGLPRVPGLPDDGFAHDGQITKAPVRALTLAALAPRAGDLLWDLGAGSGSVSVEWCLAQGRAIAIERRPDRAENIRANAAAFGVDHRLRVVNAASAEALAGLPPPQAVFVGGGFDAALFAALWPMLPPGARLVVNAVTLQTEALLAALHSAHGGDLLRIELARAAPLGGLTGWQPARPVVQWAVVR